MHRILIVDDDEATLMAVKIRLSNAYELICTKDPEEALGLAALHKPDAILLDLMMPRCSGFELCQSFRSFGCTSLIPIIVITAEPDAKYKEHCANLGAVGYFEKPLDFDEMKRTLTMTIGAKRRERRAHVRVRMRLPLKLGGTDASRRDFEEKTITENVSAAGFCATVCLRWRMARPWRLLWTEIANDTLGKLRSCAKNPRLHLGIDTALSYWRERNTGPFRAPEILRILHARC
jgi:CheY-like chemotaxis protein